MAANPPTTPDAHDSAARLARSFGAAIRHRREALHLRQEDIAFSTGIGRRFIIELEAGKPSCQLGKALAVAAAVGLRPIDMMTAQPEGDEPLLPDLQAPTDVDLG